MIETLNKIKGAVPTKGLVPVLTHLRIYEDRIQAGNGAIAIDAPFPFIKDLDITVPARAFIRAAATCKGDFKCKVTPTNKLSIIKNKFRVLLALYDNEKYALCEKSKKQARLGAPLLPVLRTLEPFISGDASRPWSRSVLLKDGFAYATNNVTLVRLPYGTDMEITIPSGIVRELIRIAEEPVAVFYDDVSITFQLEDDIWLRGCLTNVPWPNVAPLIPDTTPPPLPAYFAESLDNIVPFVENERIPIIILGEEGMYTDEGVSQAAVDLASFPVCKFRAEPLVAVAQVATAMDFSAYPKPCVFTGEGDLKGVLVGVL